MSILPLLLLVATGGAPAERARTGMDDPVASSASPASPASPASSERIVSFIGEQLSFERIDCIRLVEPTDDHENVDEDGVPYDLRCGEDDINVRARYRVVMPIDGVVEEEVEFVATGWTKFYAPGRWAVLYLRETRDGWIMPAGLGAAVWPTADGSWAACGEYDRTEPVEFAGDVVFARTDALSPHGVAQRFPKEDFEVVGQRVYCLRGETLPTLVTRLDRELQKARESGFGELDLHATRP